jgi:hypothetical protein
LSGSIFGFVSSIRRPSEILADNYGIAEERLPVAEGWTPSTSSINGLSLNILVAKLAWATESSVRWESKPETVSSGAPEKEL